MERISLKGFNRFGVASLAALALLLCISTASAGVIGNMDSGSSGTVIVSLNSIAFTPDPSALPVGGAPWNSDVASSTALLFAGCVGGLGSAGCLFNREGIKVDSPITAGSIGDPTFLTFESHASLVYSLLSIDPGSANTNCALVVNTGDSCSVYTGSPIVLTKVGSNTVASISLHGKASDTGVGGLATGSSYNGGFSQTLTQNLPNGQAPTAANIQLYYCPSGFSGGGTACNATDFAANRTIESSQSGSFFATAVPEPGTWSMLLCGGGLLAAGFRRRRKQS